MNRNAMGRAGRIVRRMSPALATISVVLAPVAATAGQIYGQVTANGRSVSAGVSVSLDCSSGATARTQTDRFGSYRLYVATTGRCRMTIEFAGMPLNTGVVSYANPTRYNFDISGQGRNRHLVRR